MKDKELTKQDSLQLRSRSNICEEDGKIILRLEMPGVKKENLDININNNRLEILGKRSDKEPKGEYIIRERRSGDFFQLYTIDDTIDREKIEASLETGILTVTLHLKEAEKPRKITVTTK